MASSLLALAKKSIGLSILNNIRSLSTTSILRLKEIKEVQNGQELLIYGEEIKSGRESLLLPNKSETACYLCATGLDVKHTDVLILSQFVRSNGSMMPRRITGLCRKQQRRVSTLVTMAHKAGLMPNLKPPNSKNDPKKRYQWKKCNTYFDESTIKLKNR